MDKLQLNSETDHKKNDIVTHDGETWMIVDIEDDFYWIRNVMDHTRTEKVQKDKVGHDAGYGDTAPKTAPQLASVVAEQEVSNLTLQQVNRVKELTEEIEGKTLREVKNLEHPSA